MLYYKCTCEEGNRLVSWMPYPCLQLFHMEPPNFFSLDFRSCDLWWLVLVVNLTTFIFNSKASSWTHLRGCFLGSLRWGTPILHPDKSFGQIHPTCGSPCGGRWHKRTPKKEGSLCFLCACLHSHWQAHPSWAFPLLVLEAISLGF